MELKRRKFQGVLNILSFNRHFYAYGLLTLAIIILSQLLFHWSYIALWIIIFLFLYGLIIPLLVSAYVYDFSGYYSLEWLKKFKLQEQKPTNILNINAGFDETSFIINVFFPQADLKVFDFYNAAQHTEPAIVRARKVSIFYPGIEQVVSISLPLESDSIDLIFLLSAAHEIRSQDEKILFLKECYRLCKQNGKVIMVEHLRDFPNFLAFSIGFTHFFSRKVWKRSFLKAGFSSINETKFTAFMSVFECTK